ncbi:MAG: hypothetical protein J0I52_04800 [Bordetella sp.]|nr:hypothetical protein [Bordetella sp.]
MTRVAPAVLLTMSLALTACGDRRSAAPEASSEATQDFEGKPVASEYAVTPKPQEKQAPPAEPGA